MNNNIFKIFLLRGCLFGGFGPIIAGIIYLILSYSIDKFTLSGPEVFIAIISTYALAFVQAGASVFNQIENWGIAKSLFLHLSALYITYVSCYLVNSWIPFNWGVIAVFTAIFIVIYFIIWFTVYICIRITCKKINKKLMD